MGIKLTTEKFIEKAISIHGDKYDYSKVEYKNYDTKVCIICHEHGEFWQTPHDHLGGHGCPKCTKCHKPTIEEFIEKARNVHGNKYDYSKVEYINANTIVKIICPIHGEFMQKPSDHLNGCGCQACAGKLKITTEEFIEKAKQVHGDKYDYSKVNYINSHTKICIICPIHGEFWQTPYDHIHNHGCPICKESKGEKNIRTYLVEHNIKYEEQKRFKECKNKRILPFDFYLPDYNLCIEYQGKQHFLESNLYTDNNKLKIQQHNDEIKRDWCSKINNPKLLEIKYTEFNDIEKILSEELI